MRKVDQAGRFDGRGTSKREPIIIDDEEDDENARTVSIVPKKLDGVAQQVISDKTRELETLRVSRISSCIWTSAESGLHRKD
jgi:hypothetical protein